MSRLEPENAAKIRSRGIQGLAKGRSDLFRFTPEDLNVKEGWNGRAEDDPDNAQHIESLALSIAANGILTPLTVYLEGDRIFVSDGHCRLAAVKLAIARGADIKTIPVQNESKHTSEADRLAGQITRNSGKQFSPLEKARVYKRLSDFGWSEMEIAEKVGASRSHVLELLQLQAAPAAVTDLVRHGEVSATLASQELRRAKGNGAKASARLAEGKARAKAEGKTRVTARHLGEKARPGLDKVVETILRDVLALPMPISVEALRPVLMAHLGMVL